MAYYRVKFNTTRTVTDTDPETGEARLDEAGNPITRTETVLNREGQPLVKTAVVFGLHNVHRILANPGVVRVSVNRFIRKLAEVTPEEIAAGEAEYQRQQTERRLEAARAEVASLESSLANLGAAQQATQATATPEQAPAAVERQDQ